MTTCEVCSSPIPDRTGPPPPGATDRILLHMAAVQNQVRVKGFCSQDCLQTFVASLEASATCAWCDGPIKGTKRLLGGHRERYCSQGCYSRAGRAYFVYWGVLRRAGCSLRRL